MESIVVVLDFVPILVFLSHAHCAQKDIFHFIAISGTKHHELRECFFVTLCYENKSSPIFHGLSVSSKY